MKKNNISLAIQPNERIVVLDIIRGFAIFGIFLVNMFDFHSPWLYTDLSQLWPEPLDRFTDILVDIFAQASFYTLFSFLFGYGMVIFLQRLKEKGLPTGKYIVRRLLVLLLFGMIHAFLIWHGDILISYALIGFILLLFMKTKPQTKLKWAIWLIVIPTLLFGGLVFLLEVSGEASSKDFLPPPHLAQEAIANYSSGTWPEIFEQRLKDWLYVNNMVNAPFMIVNLLPMFLLGAYASEIQFFQKLQERRAIIFKICLSAGSIGILVKLFPYIFTVDSLGLMYIQDSIGGPSMAIFYITGIGLLSLGKGFYHLLKPLSYIGRLSLSNYLFQSIVCTFIFYSYGLGLYGQVRPVYGLCLNILIFSIQIIGSKLWLQKYAFGPAEWVWRRLTYDLGKPKENVDSSKLV